MQRECYLTVAAACGWAARYLAEWIEFHRLVGVERFYLYNNNEREAQREVLRPYVEEGLVVLYEFPGLPVQQRAFEHCLAHHAEESRWMAFIDTDEFFFSPVIPWLPDILSEYEEYPGIGVCRAFYGPSGHRTPPPGLVLENYVLRLAPPDPHGGYLAVKSIVDPMRTTQPLNPHEFLFEGGPAVDEHKRPLPGFMVEKPTYERLRINHYWTKSEDEGVAKFSRIRADTGRGYSGTRGRRAIQLREEAFGVEDRLIHQFLPELRERVAARESTAGEPGAAAAQPPAERA